MRETELREDRRTVLVVDDTPANIALIRDVLKDRFRVKAATNGGKALAVARSGSPPDLILLDVTMPGLDGYGVCAELKKDEATRDIPVIFLTGRRNAEDEEKGFGLGAADYILKPFSPSVVLARVNTHLGLKAAADFLRDKNRYLERMVERRTREVLAVQEVTILALASLAETRDQETGNHLRRTQRYVKALAVRLSGHPRFREALAGGSIDLLYKSAPLHDIGKVGIPDRILLKPGRLDPDEFAVMKTHAALGRRAIEKAERDFGVNAEFLGMAKEIAHHHHEQWDGTGYPDGLRGDGISVPARLMALADVYDALSSDRVYRKRLPPRRVNEIVRAGRGVHFDPDVVDAFIDLEDEFHAIARLYADDGEAEASGGRS